MVSILPAPTFEKFITSSIGEFYTKLSYNNLDTSLSMYSKECPIDILEEL